MFYVASSIELLHAINHSFIHSPIHSFIQIPIVQFIHSSIHPSIHLFIHCQSIFICTMCIPAFVHTYIHSLIHSHSFKTQHAIHVYQTYNAKTNYTYNSKIINQGWLDIYRRYISLTQWIYLIYIGYFCLKISDIFNFYGVFKIFLMWHTVTTFWFSVCVFCWLMTCALSIFSVLDNFCQISPLHSNEVWITRVLHLMCNAHTRILLFGSKFHIILAIYVQMLDMYIENIEKIENIGYFRYFRKYHDIFQPCY